MLSRNNPKFMQLVLKGIPLEKLEAILKPGNSSGVGFLGADEKLLDLIYADWKTVEKYHTSHEEIARALSEAIKANQLPNKDYKIKHVLMSGGLQGCPWNCEGRYKRGNGVITISGPEALNCDTELATVRTMGGEVLLRKMMSEMAKFREEIPAKLTDMNFSQDLTDRIAVVTELHPHLIEEHYFFEGKKSPYRADPQILIPALNLCR